MPVLIIVFSKIGLSPAKIGSLTLPKFIKKFYSSMYPLFLKYCIDQFGTMPHKIVRKPSAKILPLLQFTTNKPYIFDHAGKHRMSLYCITTFPQCKCRQAFDRFLLCPDNLKYRQQNTALDKFSLFIDLLHCHNPANNADFLFFRLFHCLSALCIASTFYRLLSCTRSLVLPPVCL